MRRGHAARLTKRDRSPDLCVDGRIYSKPMSGARARMLGPLAALAPRLSSAHGSSVAAACQLPMCPSSPSRLSRKPSMKPRDKHERGLSNVPPPLPHKPEPLERIARSPHARTYYTVSGPKKKAVYAHAPASHLQCFHDTCKLLRLAPLRPPSSQPSPPVQPAARSTSPAASFWRAAGEHGLSRARGARSASAP